MRELENSHTITQKLIPDLLFTNDILYRFRFPFFINKRKKTHKMLLIVCSIL